MKKTLAPSGASCWYHHPERMEITQPRVARNELPWDNGLNAPYPERVASWRQGSRGGTGKMRPGQSKDRSRRSRRAGEARNRTERSEIRRKKLIRACQRTVGLARKAKRQRTAALQNLAAAEAPRRVRQRFGVRLSSAALLAAPRRSSNLTR